LYSNSTFQDVEETEEAKPAVTEEKPAEDSAEAKTEEEGGDEEGEDNE
jgi:hypothetical protein